MLVGKQMALTRSHEVWGSRLNVLSVLNKEGEEHQRIIVGRSSFTRFTRVQSDNKRSVKNHYERNVLSLWRSSLSK